MQTLLPAVDLTPTTTDTLERLQLKRASRRGVNRVRLTPVGEWTSPLEAAQVAAHLGVPLPHIPVLSRRGYTTSVRGFGGHEMFDHPVPPATDPPPAHGHGDQHSVLVLHMPPGVDAGEVVLEDDRPAGAGWMQITRGRYLLMPGDPGEDDPEMQAWEESRRRSSTMLRSPGIPPVYVRRRWQKQTSSSWRCLAAGSLFDVSLVLPFAPLEAVSALTEAAAAARSQA